MVGGDGRSLRHCGGDMGCVWFSWNDKRRRRWLEEELPHRSLPCHSSGELPLQNVKKAKYGLASSPGTTHERRGPGIHCMCMCWIFTEGMVKRHSQMHEQEMTKRPITIVSSLCVCVCV